MNQKETRKLNDISIIIGNLPKRLQDKIIIRDEGSNNGANVSTTKNGDSSSDKQAGDGLSVANEETATRQATEVTAIDYFLGLPANAEGGRTATVKPVLESSGTTNAVQAKVMQKHDLEKVDPQESASIPGLIRLNAENAKKFNTATSSSRSNSLRNHERRNRHQARPMSPVRIIWSIDRPTWFQKLYGLRLPSLFDTLQKMISQNKVIKNWKQLQTIRKELQGIFKHLLLTNLKFCCEENVDSFFWKILFYNIRRHLKQQQQQNNMPAVKCIQIIIDDGIKFYDPLFEEILKHYLNQSKTTFIMLNGTWSQQNMEFIAKVVAQKLLVCLGDLWRYKIKDAEGQDYTMAEKYYQQAQALVPSNGVPYKQLAIIAIINREKFDAIYFHMRCLMSSNARYAFKVALLTLFDEIRKEYKETELKSSPIHSNCHNNNQHSNSKSMRKEVWIYPDGMRRLHRTDLNGNSNYKLAICEEKRFMEMSAEELLRRITSLYLYIIGKLFTGVGMETIVEHQRKLFLQLGVLLKREKLFLSRTRLLKILALNIWVIEQNLNKDTPRYHAFNFCNQFFGLMLRKTNELLADMNNNPKEFEDECFLELNTVLQYSRIYVLWLKYHIDVWEPIKSEEHVYLNCWLELEKLFQLLKQTKLSTFSCKDIKFEEDVFLSCFTPMAKIIFKPKDDSISDESLQFKARLKVLGDFEDFYYVHKILLDNVETAHFVNEILNSDIKQALDDLQSTHIEKTNVKGVADIEGDGDMADVENNSDDDVENNSESIVVNGDTVQMKKSLKVYANIKIENEQLSHLSKLKKELEAKTHVMKMYSNKLEEILKFVDTKLYIEVRPKYLLPDTNCFIDCLEDFERIVNEFKRYTLIVPLTVVKELDGLSKGVKVEPHQENRQKHRIHHYDDVSTRAKKSLDFIKTAKSHIKCATTKGSIINASLFALVEEENVSNDDKILATALALSKTMSSETSKDGKCFIQTELVLITTDRNLRVKALSRNLTVGELPEFIQWAKGCN